MIRVLSLLRAIEHIPTRDRVLAERALAELEAVARVPMVFIRSWTYVDVNGVSRQCGWWAAEDSVTGPANEAEHLGIQLAQNLRQQGRRKFWMKFSRQSSGTKNFAHGALQRL